MRKTGTTAPVLEGRKIITTTKKNEYTESVCVWLLEEQWRKCRYGLFWHAYSFYRVPPLLFFFAVAAVITIFYCFRYLCSRTVERGYYKYPIAILTFCLKDFFHFFSLLLEEEKAKRSPKAKWRPGTRTKSNWSTDENTRWDSECLNSFLASCVATTCYCRFVVVA